MKIIIASSGRAHLLDCARELQKYGHEVTFICATKRDTFKKYGLKTGGINIIYYIFPFYFLHKIIHNNFTLELLRSFKDYIAYLLVGKCDVFIAQSPNYSKTMRKVKRKYGAVCLLDRGSTHVEFFNEMKMIYDGKPQTDSYRKMDAAQYKLADYIVVGSSYVKNSFMKNGFDADKIFVNNYGVELKNFSPTMLETKKCYDLIMVGNWCKRKGCDVLTDVCKRFNHSVLHVGAVTDIPFPDNDLFTHYDIVPEKELLSFYSKAKVFILLSKDEGLALVQVQAVACGLPLVITHNTGGEDLKQYVMEKDFIHVVDDFNDVDEIETNIREALQQADGQDGERCYCDNLQSLISWSAYGKRYQKFLACI